MRHLDLASLRSMASQAQSSQAQSSQAQSSQAQSSQAQSSQAQSSHAARSCYAEWLRVPAMSSGLYVLDAGADDPQLPHREDEVYVVVSGSAQFTGGEETTVVGPGSVIFVPALEEHRFHDITKRLAVVVVFAPAETDERA